MNWKIVLIIGLSILVIALFLYMYQAKKKIEELTGTETETGTDTDTDTGTGTGTTERIATGIINIRGKCYKCNGKWVNGVCQGDLVDVPCGSSTN